MTLCGLAQLAPGQGDALCGLARGLGVKMTLCGLAQNLPTYWVKMTLCGLAQYLLTPSLGYAVRPSSG